MIGYNVLVSGNHGNVLQNTRHRFVAQQRQSQPAEVNIMDNYVKERILGRGSFGTVYLIRHRLADGKLSNYRHVLKEITIRDEKQRDGARLEIRLLSQLHHPNIIKYLDSFQSCNGNLCLVMEHCSGGDVNAKIQRRRGAPFSEELIVCWFHQLCSAVQYIHQCKILHRDVKAGNIFVSHDETAVKLGDFGVAKLLNRCGEMALTCVGTPSYLSPEICNQRQYNSKTDIWGLGCVIYQLITLRPPFSGRNIHQLLTQILRSPFMPMPGRYSYELRNTVALMLKKNPQQRPSAELLLKRRLFQSKIAVATSKKRQQRKQWKPPTQTLIGALSLLSLTDSTAIENVSSNCVTLHSDQTYVLSNGTSAFHESEKNKMFLEMMCGSERLKEGSPTLTTRNNVHLQFNND